jgi:protein-S-isoprenylcysteine O-methyltransferase Ste14
MSTELSEQSLTRLVSGIVDDAQELMGQQLALLKHEIRKDLREAKEATLTLVMSGALMGIGLLLLGFMTVYLLNWLASPQLPMWVCFSIVSCLLGLSGLLLYWRARQKLDALTPLPEDSMTAMKENLQWTTKQN